MSHYARTNESFKARSVDEHDDVDGPEKTVRPGLALKNVKIEQGGFLFDVLFADGWRRMFTAEDLPAFTDKGTAHRVKYAQRLVTLRPGRPSPSSAPVTSRIVVKVTENQQQWVKQIAAKDDISISDFVRAKLILSGMPE